jgi:hypothetical protein
LKKTVIKSNRGLQKTNDKVLYKRKLEEGEVREVEEGAVIASNDVLSIDEG